MKAYGLIFVLFFIVLISCTSEAKYTEFSLKETDVELKFQLDSVTKNEFYCYSTYKDNEGKDFFVFQNQGKNTLLFYELKNQSLAFKIDYPIEGDNGIGLGDGFYIHNLDSIYIPNRDIKEISLTNKSCILIDKYPYENDKDNKPLSIFCFGAANYKPATVIGRTMYIYSGPNRYVDYDPVTVTLNMDTKEIKALPFDYPEYPGSETKIKKYGLENLFSRCFDGKRFVYSFYYDEDIYVASPSHDSIRKIPVKSKYFNEVQLPDELTASPMDFCENAWYGNLIYDKYRDLYYRVAYPSTEIEKNIRPIELSLYGRKNFSIIILDKDFNKVGETMFPDYTYNSNIMFVHEDGLYISDSHYLNPNFSDDELSLKLFKIVK